MDASVPFCIRLPAVLDLGAAAGLLDMLRRMPASAALDASAVEVLTSPCAQIIMAALATHPAAGILRPSEAFVSGFAELALEWREYPRAEPPDAPKSIPDPPASATDGQIAFAPCRNAAETDVPDPVAKQTDGASMAKRILTIDDSRTIRDMLNLTLTEAGFEVLQAVDGQDGLDVFAKEHVDIVITDINMPKMNGYDVIRHIRGMPEHKKMPVLVLTTESEAEKRKIAREAGATGWLVKPFDPERLIETINKVAP
jgi:two-component system chemotaxis response regulator CheY